MAKIILLVLAIVLFAIAAFLGGIHATYGDLVAIGLAVFAAAHLPLDRS